MALSNLFNALTDTIEDRVDKDKKKRLSSGPTVGNPLADYGLGDSTTISMGTLTSKYPGSAKYADPRGIGNSTLAYSSDYYVDAGAYTIRTGPQVVMAYCRFCGRTRQLSQGEYHDATRPCTLCEESRSASLEQAAAKKEAEAKHERNLQKVFEHYYQKNGKYPWD